MRFNLSCCLDSMASVAGSLGCDTKGQTSLEAAESAIAAVVQLQHAVSIRTRLSDLGLAREQIPWVASKAFQIKRLMDVNPRRATEMDLVKIIESAF